MTDAEQGGSGVLDEFMPSDPLMAIAWRDCLLWAATDPDALAAFEADTGVRYVAPRTVLDRMIDEASGWMDAIGRQFVEWFTVNLWGVE